MSKLGVTLSVYCVRACVRVCVCRCNWRGREGEKEIEREREVVVVVDVVVVVVQKGTIGSENNKRSQSREGKSPHTYTNTTYRLLLL